MSMIKDIFGGIFNVTNLAGLVLYLFRQSFWLRFLEPIVKRKSEPCITFEDGLSIKNIDADIDINLEEKIIKEIDRERKNVPEARLTNPYDNPWALMFECPENYKIYNKQREEYLQHEEKRIRHVENQKYEQKVMKPLKLVIQNKGKVPTGKCDIEISFSECANVYEESAFAENSDIRLEKPVLAKGNAFPCLKLASKTYKFKKLDASKCVCSPLKYRLDVLNQQMIDDNTLPIYYVDLRKVTQLNILWKIIEPSYTEPLTGELVVHINKDL